MGKGGKNLALGAICLKSGRVRPRQANIDISSIPIGGAPGNVKLELGTLAGLESGVPRGAVSRYSKFFIDLNRYLMLSSRCMSRAETDVGRLVKGGGDCGGKGAAPLLSWRTLFDLAFREARGRAGVGR